MDGFEDGLAVGEGDDFVVAAVDYHDGALDLLGVFQGGISEPGDEADGEDGVKFGSQVWDGGETGF